jgi:hypothetical protein
MSFGLPRPQVFLFHPSLYHLWNVLISANHWLLNRLSPSFSHPWCYSCLSHFVCFTPVFYPIVSSPVHLTNLLLHLLHPFMFHHMPWPTSQHHYSYWPAIPTAIPSFFRKSLAVLNLPENKGSKFLWSVHIYTSTYHHIPEDKNLHLAVACKYCMWCQSNSYQLNKAQSMISVRKVYNKLWIKENWVPATKLTTKCNDIGIITSLHRRIIAV